jgi:hypothetical protein
MGLTLPTVSVTLGPEYASQNNAAFTSIDAHDHSSGKGVKIPTSGLNINADLEFNSFKATELKASQYIPNSSTLTGSTNAHSLYSVLGNLYWTNSSGSAIQLTSGGSIVATPSAIISYETQAVTGDIVILAAATPVYFFVDTAAARNITLPLAASVVTGRIYKFTDITGTANTNNITIIGAGSDTINGAATKVVDSNFESTEIVSDGASAWYIS